MGGAWATSSLGWWRPTIGRSAEAGVAGVVRDILTDQPVAGVVIAILGSSGAAAVTDGGGHFSLALPPGTYEVQASAADYLSMARNGKVVTDGGPTTVDFALVPANPTPAEQEALYARLATLPEWPPSDVPLLTAQGELYGAAVVVPETIWVSLPGGTVTEMSLDEYLRHVVPAEMPASWPREALRAQAVAARTYAVAYGATSSSHPICTDTRCQVYGSATYASTDEAVYSTHGVVATYNGSIITAFYFARCNGATTRNSENALSWQNSCAELGWNYVAYCRARPCSGHAPSTYSVCGYYGHGVGMCQTGANDFAAQGLPYDQILGRYYTGIQLTARGAPQPTSPVSGHTQVSNSRVTLQWTGESGEYLVTVLLPNGGNITSTWQTATSYTTPSLGAGNYGWYVVGRTAGVDDGQSASRTFRLVDYAYSRSISGLSRG